MSEPVTWLDAVEYVAAGSLRASLDPDSAFSDAGEQT